MELTTGRPTVMSVDVLQKLEQAFLMDCTDEEACLYADISARTLYNYQEANPEFLQRKRALRHNPFLIARQSILRGIEKDPRLALMYMERKKKDEFSTRREYTDANGADLVSEQAVAEALKSLDKV
jgi:hypothetical protein